MRLRRLLQLYEGEGRTVALAVAVAFLASGGGMIAQSGIDALFFTRYGVDQLPTMYLILGPTMFAAMLGVGVLLARVGRGRAFVAIPLAIALAAVAGRAAVETEADWIFGALWVAREVSEMMSVLAVWGLAGLVTDTRQAKRFFPLIAAGGVFGLITGGFATRPLAGALGPENLIAVWAAAVGCVAILSWILVTRAGAAPHLPRFRRRRRDGNVIAFVRRSPLLSWMAIGVCLTSTLFSLLYFGFSRAAVERYPDENDLAGFFGTFFALATATAFVLSLVVTSRLLRRFGVPTIVLVLPLIYAAAFGVLTIAATFAALTLFRFLQVAWWGGGGSSAWEALVNAVPASRRDQIRAFLYGVPIQLGTIAAGVVALATQSLSQPRALYVAGLAAAVLAVLTLARGRREYPAALVDALREGRPAIFGETAALRTPAAEPDAAALAVLHDGLADSDPRVRLLAAHGLGEIESPSAVPALSAAVRDADAAVRVAAIDALATIGLSSPEPILAGTSDEAPEVRLASIRALASLEMNGRSTGALEACLLDPDARVRSYAAAALLRHGGNGAARSLLTRSAGSSLADDRVAALEAIRFVRPGGLEDLIVKAFDDESPTVRAAAVRAAALDGARGSVPRLIGLLGSDDAAVAQAATEVLCSLEADGVTAAMIRESAARSVADAVRDHELASTLRVDTPPLRLLHDSLLARAHKRATHALRAVGVLRRDASVAVALESLPVSDPVQRANAIEVIEAVGERDIVRPLLALWEPDAGRRRRDVDRLDELRGDPDEWISACAEWAASVERGDMSKTLATVPVLERVVFLRAAPLFAELAPQDIRPIAEIAEEHEFAEGETIAEKGETGDATYIIVSGEVEVFDTSDGREVSVGVRTEGDVIGEMSVLSNRPRMATLVARTPVRVLVIGRNEFQSILRERPETALALIRVLGDRLEERSRAVGAPPE